jgi:hypothetical protein
MREKHLQRDHPVDFRVVGPRDLADAAMTELLDQPVAAERHAIHLLTISSQPHHGRANRLRAET